MKNILLTTDLNAGADRALERAFYIAQEHNAKLHILHVISHHSGTALNDSLKEEAESLIQRMLNDYKERAPLLEVNVTVVLSKDIFLEVLEHAHKIRADLIVMGIHGKTKLKDLFVGTTIERVIRKGKTPVLMVKDKPLCPYQTVVANIDYAPASRAALRLATKIAPSHKASFTALHAHHRPDYLDELANAYTVPLAKEQLNISQDDIMEAFVNTEKDHHNKELGGASLNLSGKSIEGFLPQTLIKEAETIKADLISIGAHGESTFIHSKLGGTTREILTSPPCDVLIVHE